MNKLFGLGDLKLITVNSHCLGNWIPPLETFEVLTAVGDSAYILYSMYRTYPFKESPQLTDESLAKLLGWDIQKVQRNRLVLEKANLFRTIRYGTKQDGITKVFVGRDILALFDAGMPSDILEPKALTKLKREFQVTSSQDLVLKATAIVTAFEQDPSKYK